MTRTLLCLLALFALVAIALPARAALEAGTAAPVFTAPASHDGKELSFSLAESLKKGTVVVYFFPSAFTGGCNLQAHTFATEIDKFTAAGATVVGVSLDSIARLDAFSADPEYCAGKLTIVSDADGAIAKSYGLEISPAPPAGTKDSRGAEIDHGFAQRTTFVITGDGKIAATIGGVKAQENVAQTLAAVEKLKKPAG